MYLWADGVDLQARMEATPNPCRCRSAPRLKAILRQAQEELVGFHAGMRGSAQSWRELLVERHGGAAAPEVDAGDGAPGFWKALDEIFPGTKHRR